MKDPRDYYIVFNPPKRVRILHLTDWFTKLKVGDLGCATAESGCLLGGLPLTQLTVKWDNGSTLMLVKTGSKYDDDWEFIEDDENGQSKCD